MESNFIHVHSGVIGSDKAKIKELEEMVKDLDDRLFHFRGFAVDQMGSLRKRVRELEDFKSGIENRKE